MITKSKLEARLHQFPPFLCYALTRVRKHRQTGHERYRRETIRERTRHVPVKQSSSAWRRITREEFAERSGLNERTVERLSRQTDWLARGVSVETMILFLKASGVDLFDIESTTKKLKNIAQADQKFAHLTTWQRKCFDRVVEKWQKGLEKKV